MDLLAVIPARYASSRFPGKPLAIISGKTMIERVYSQSCMAFDNVYVATDHPLIYETITKSGGNAVMTSESHINGTSRVLEAMYKVEEIHGCKCKIVINIQGDEPFIEPAQLNELHRCFSNPQTQIATLAHKVTDIDELLSPDVVKVVFNSAGEALFFSRSPIPYNREIPKEEWCAKGQYFKHIGLYGYRRETLIAISSLNTSPLENAEKLEQLRWLENGIKIVVAETMHPSYSVDTPGDIEQLRAKGVI